MNERHEPHCIPRVSWNAIIVGALVGIGLSFLLNLFSISMGLSAFATDADNASIAIGGVLGIAIATFVAMYIAGFAAGHVGRAHCKDHNWGVLYGFATWCLSLLIMALFASHIGNYVAAYSSFIAKPMAVIAPMQVTASSDTPIFMTVNSQHTLAGIGLGSLVIFGLFFVGAFASCVGGYYGMACKDHCKK